MENKIIVNNMMCNNCASRIINTLKANKIKASCNLENKEVSLSYNEKIIDLESIKKIIIDLGFEVK